MDAHTIMLNILHTSSADQQAQTTVVPDEYNRRMIDIYESTIKFDYPDASDTALYVCYYNVCGTNTLLSTDVHSMLILTHYYTIHDPERPMLNRKVLIGGIYCSYGTTVDNKPSEWLKHHIKKYLHGLDNYIIPLYHYIITHMDTIDIKQWYQTTVSDNQTITNIVQQHIYPLYLIYELLLDNNIRITIHDNYHQLDFSDDRYINFD